MGLVELKTVKLQELVTKQISNFPIFESILNKLNEWREERLLDNDLLFLLTYMASLTTANINRDKIFELVAEKSEYTPSMYFRQVRDLTQKWHYDYATACELVAEKMKNEKIKNLFNRFSNAIASGEPDEEFIEREWKTFKTVRKDEYERDLESLRKWSDAYVSILVSTTLISVVILLSIVIYKLSEPLTMIIAAIFATLGLSLFGVFVLYSSAPKDAKTHSLEIKSVEQLKISKIQPFALLAFAISLTFGILLTTYNPGLKVFGFEIEAIGLIISGLILLPLGILGYKDDKKITGRDESFTSVIRSLGATISGAGVGVVEALSRIDTKNMGELKDLLIPLHKRLSLGLDAKLSWEKFCGESGSYLVSKLSPIFIDATDLGGDANTIGEIVSSSNLEMVLLRLKRSLISSGFVNLMIPLHTSMVALILFITKLLEKFATLIAFMFESQFSAASGATSILSSIPLGALDIGLFSAVPIDLFEIYALFATLILISSNALSMKVVSGSANYMVYFYASLLLLLSGVLYILVPIGVDRAFSFSTLLGGG